MEDVLFESERRQDREQIAEYLESVAEKLRAGGPVTLRTGEESVTLDPPASPEFEVKAEREGPADGSGELSVEFEIEWDEDASGGDAGDGELAIE